MKRFIKNNFKTIMTILITTIIVGSVSIYAASQFSAKDISFTPTNENFKKENGEPIDNVEDALNELYKSSNKTTIHNFDLNTGKDITTNDAYYYTVKTEKENLLVIYTKFTINTTYDGQDIITITNLPGTNYNLIYKNISGTENASIRKDSIVNGTFTTIIDTNYGGYKNKGNSTWFRYIYTYE